MVIDSSALLAILLRESDQDRLARAIVASPVRLASAIIKLKAGMFIIGAMDRRGLRTRR